MKRDLLPTLDMFQVETLPPHQTSQPISLSDADIPPLPHGKRLCKFQVTSFEGVIIIDAGGGTVDLSAYSMKLSPTSCKEFASAECKSTVCLEIRDKDPEYDTRSGQLKMSG